MSSFTIGTLRAVLAACVVGALLVQIVIVPLFWRDLDGAPLAPRIALTTIIVLGIVCLQVCAVCVWMLLALVRRGTVFSAAAFRYVDVIVGAVAAASTLAFVTAAILAPTAAPPGVVGLIGGAGLGVAGIALVIVVMRALLRQAVDRDGEATRLQTELDEVI